MDSSPLPCIRFAEKEILMFTYLSRSLLLLAVACLLLPAGAKDKPGKLPAGHDHILAYHSSITVNPDASLRVCEKIKVRFDGETKQHGLVKVLPRVYGSAPGKSSPLGFHIMGAKRDDAVETFRSRLTEKNLLVFLGKKDVLLDPGAYTYSLTYKIRRQLKSYPDRDELRWNVTTFYWAQPIDRAMASVILPTGVPADQIKVKAFAGRRGKGTACRASVNKQGVALVSTKNALKPGEGLTIIVSFPKGFVKLPKAAPAKVRKVVTPDA